MYGSLVVRVVVHTLDDVDFARCRPTLAVGPERGPRPTARGHVNAVHDNKSAGEAELRLNAHGIAIARNLGRSVDTHNGMASIVDRYQVVRLLRKESGTGHGEAPGAKCPTTSTTPTAVGWSTYCTIPLVGSPPVKKFHPEKNVFPDYTESESICWDPRTVVSKFFKVTGRRKKRRQIGFRHARRTAQRGNWKSDWPRGHQWRLENPF